LCFPRPLGNDLLMLVFVGVSYKESGNRACQRWHSGSLKSGLTSELSWYFYHGWNTAVLALGIRHPFKEEKVLSGHEIRKCLPPS
jgi:hypothetical protein